MSERMDSNNSQLKQEGKLEQAGEKLKGGVDKVAEKAKELLHKD
jgi:hypothetical protein